MEEVLCQEVSLLLPRVPTTGQGVRGGEVCLTAEVLWWFWWIYRWKNKVSRIFSLMELLRKVLFIQHLNPHFPICGFDLLASEVLWE